MNFQNKNKPELVFRGFIRGRHLKNSARSFQVGRHFQPGHPYPDILIVVSMYWSTHFNTTGPLFLGFHRKK